MFTETKANPEEGFRTPNMKKEETESPQELFLPEGTLSKPKKSVTIRGVLNFTPNNEKKGNLLAYRTGLQNLARSGKNLRNNVLRTAHDAYGIKVVNVEHNDTSQLKYSTIYSNKASFLNEPRSH